MKLFICDKYKISSFILPDKVAYTYTVNYVYENEITEMITLNAINNRWCISSSSNLNVIYNQTVIHNVALQEFQKFDLKFNDINEVISLYVLPDVDKYYDYMLNYQSIGIGSSKTNAIHFNSNNIESTHATLIKNENNFYIQTNNLNQKTYIYVNKKRVTQSKLKPGDVIFIGGLIVIYMGDFIKINNYNNSIFVSYLEKKTAVSVDNKYKEPTEIEKASLLYTENDLFFHTPQLKSVIEKQKIKIDLPPEKDNNEEVPAILTIGATSVMGLVSAVTAVNAIYSFMNQQSDLFSLIIQLFMSLTMLIGSILFPILTNNWQKRKKERDEKRRQERYLNYLKEKEEDINKIIGQQQFILNENNYKLESIISNIDKNTGSIWKREIGDDDFLTIRLGIGSIPAYIEIEKPEKQFSLYDDNLRDKAFELVEKKYELSEVPITVSLIENRILPIVINSQNKKQFIEGLMLQLMFYYSGKDLKIVSLIDKDNEDDWEYLKYIPHSWDDNYEKRFFASTETEMNQISLYLEKIYDERINGNLKESDDQIDKTDENSYLKFSEYYLIITDNYKLAKKLPIINKILKSDINFGFSILILDSYLKNLPSKIERFVDIEDNESGIVNKKTTQNGNILFKAEYLNNVDLNKYAKIIGNIPLSTKVSASTIPSSLTFLEMYNVGRIEQLNILSRWKENNPTLSIHAPVGIKEQNKYVELDLHEKFHGPHGLIAGSTGSGKSEFIITYILSMAVNYNPYEVQFVLIDYKGGGLAGAFENKETGLKLPHLAGTITNLDISEMKRTLVSINSEMKRRQQKFNEVRDRLGEGTIDIYKYQRLYREGKVSEPMAHLFIICDEFAELKVQQPDFMDELVSTARIGRSLGVHLILATQKPSGVVNDQIWSNARFKVCLKVQSESDSNEMLKRPEAAQIKEAGRFYLQVGSNEIFELGQSGWAGAKYTPVDKIMKKYDDDIIFIDFDGSVIMTLNDEIKNNYAVEYGQQLTNIVKYLADISKKENIVVNNLWLPKMPEKIYLQNIIKKYNVKNDNLIIDIAVGEYDKPEKQIQGIFKIRITQNNTIIFGLPGSGKENLLTTIIYSSCITYSPKYLEYYIIDFGSETLVQFSKMPHVGQVYTNDNKNKISSLFEYLDKEINKRKDILSEYLGDFLTYNQKNKEKLPQIVLIINGYETFSESVDAILDDSLSHILREGSKVGISVILTAISLNGVRPSRRDSFVTKILFQTQDEFDYKMLLNSKNNIIPEKIFGRGMTIIDDETCEFQSAFITKQDQINNQIREASRYLMDYYKYKVPDIIEMPSKITVDSLFEQVNDITNLPVGYYKENIQVAKFDLTKSKISFITGNSVTIDVTFLCGFIDLFDYVKDAKLIIYDFDNYVNTDGSSEYYGSNFDSSFDKINENDKSGIPHVYICIGISKAINVLSRGEFAKFNYIMSNLDKLKNTYFVIVENYDDLLMTTNKIESLSNIENCIWIGDNVEMCTLIKNVDFKSEDCNDELIDKAFVISDKKYNLIKCIGRGV